MNAREEIAYHLWTAVPSEDNDGAKARAEEMLDAYRAEVIAKAVSRMRAIPVDCTALTGPVWYGDGWNSAITVLEEIAEYQTPDDEAYPGELQRLRALALAVRVAAVRREDLAETQRVLEQHDAFETAARAKTTPDFFVPGRVYTRTLRTGIHLRFVCVSLTSDPKIGDREAWGWVLRSNGTRCRDFLFDHDYRLWTPEAGDQ